MTLTLTPEDEQIVRDLVEVAIGLTRQAKREGVKAKAEAARAEADAAEARAAKAEIGRASCRERV